MASPSSLYPKKVDLTNCDKEPIHLIGQVQAYGMLLVLRSSDFMMMRASANVFEFFSRKREAFNTWTLDDLFGAAEGHRLREHVVAENTTTLEVIISDAHYIIIPHYTDSLIYIELEPLNVRTDPRLGQQQLTEIITKLSEATAAQEMCDIAAALVKEFLDYDRVMVYQFDERWNGQIVAETREKELDSWLGMHYPATDIPQQARALFLKQGVRIISDVKAPSVAILPEEENSIHPLDLSKCETRASSPIHIEYLNNMKVGATLTAAIVSNGRLWGLIACHHYTPKFVTYYQRLSIKFLTQVFSTQLSLRSSNEVLALINQTATIRSTLVNQMSDGWNIHAGLTKKETSILAVTKATGAAVWLDGQLSTVGETPDNEEIIALIQWINKHCTDDYYSTRALSKEYERSLAFAKIASGILYIPITSGKEDGLIWFKPELKQTISWGGNPSKALHTDKKRISPRLSFERWNEEQTETSLAWQDYEVSSVIALRDQIKEIIIKKYDEVKELNRKLETAYKDLETFSYSVSHDLRAPLRGIDGFAQIIKEDYFESLDEYGKSAIQMIIDSSTRMNDLIDDILSFSSIGNTDTSKELLSLNDLIKEVTDFLSIAIVYPKTQLVIQEEMPRVYGDRGMIFQLLSNLIGNAFKYSKNEDSPKVEIGTQGIDGKITYFIKDNGIGFNEAYAKKIFGIFNRLVSEEFEGSGIGLAIAQRIVDNHNGRIWAKSKENEGSTFYFQLEDKE